jgi:hypothetical protein
MHFDLFLYSLGGENEFLTTTVGSVLGCVDPSTLLHLEGVHFYVELLAYISLGYVNRIVAK